MSMGWRPLGPADVADSSGFGLENGVLIASSWANLRLTETRQLLITVLQAAITFPPEAVGGRSSSWQAFYVVRGTDFDYHYNESNEGSPLIQDGVIRGSGTVAGWVPDAPIFVEGSELWYDAVRCYDPDFDPLPQVFEARVEVWDETDPDPGGGCFWTDLKGVTQACD